MTKFISNPAGSRSLSEMLFGVEPFYILTYMIAGTFAALGITWKFFKFMTAIDTRGKKQNTALIESAAHTDNETLRLHPDRSQIKIKPTIERILKE